MEINIEESETEREEMEIFMSNPSKRGREEEEEEEINDEWETVKGKSKKLRQEVSSKSNEENKKSEIYISSQEPLPKQFALARLFKDLNICDIANIKYLNPYKIRVQFYDENNIEELIFNEALIKKGWRFNKLSEVSYSYGVIKDVDLEMSEEEVMKCISCPDTVELVSLKRLDRRNRDHSIKDKKWSPSESVRLCFKGNFLPSYIYVHGVRVVVEPFVYPVTQCYLCWKLGHTVRTCNIKREICPKCSGEHANCETKVFKCVNCSGNHMAMMKSCPAYQKEKTIREIMAEYNYTYSRAAQMYAASPIIVPAVVKRDPQAKLMTVHNVTPTSGSAVHTPQNVSNICEGESNMSVILPTRPVKKKPKKRTSKSELPEWNCLLEEEYEGDTNQQTFSNADERPDKTTFTELLTRIKEVIFLKNNDFQTKVKSVIKLCVEWIIIMVVDNISDWPMAKLIYGLINHNG